MITCSTYDALQGQLGYILQKEAPPLITAENQYFFLIKWFQFYKRSNEKIHFIFKIPCIIAKRRKLEHSSIKKISLQE